MPPLAPLSAVYATTNEPSRPALNPAQVTKEMQEALGTAARIQAAYWEKAKRRGARVGRGRRGWRRWTGWFGRGGGARRESERTGRQGDGGGDEVVSVELDLWYREGSEGRKTERRTVDEKDEAR